MHEKSLYRQEMVIDIKGVFDNICTDAIVKFMKLKGVENTILKWYEDYIKNRTSEATLGGSNVTAQLTRGAPQGGCASPVFGWDFPYDDLLESHVKIGLVSARGRWGRSVIFNLDLQDHHC